MGKLIRLAVVGSYLSFGDWACWALGSYMVRYAAGGGEGACLMIIIMSFQSLLASVPV